LVQVEAAFLSLISVMTITFAVLAGVAKAPGTEVLKGEGQEFLLGATGRWRAGVCGVRLFWEHSAHPLTWRFACRARSSPRSAVLWPGPCSRCPLALHPVPAGLIIPSLPPPPDGEDPSFVYLLAGGIIGGNVSPYNFYFYRCVCGQDIVPRGAHRVGGTESGEQGVQAARRA
jgi:hypothetical protein